MTAASAGLGSHRGEEFPEFLVDLQKNKIPTCAPLKTTQLLSDAAALDRKRFDLDMESISHDCHLFQIHVGRLADRNTNNYHAKLAWSSDRELKIQHAADTIFKTRLRLFDGEKNAAQLEKEFEAFEKHLKTVTQQKDLTYVHVVPLLNWVSPSLVMAKAQTLQSQVAGSILNSSKLESVLFSCHNIHIKPDNFAKCALREKLKTYIRTLSDPVKREECKQYHQLHVHDNLSDRRVMSRKALLSAECTMPFSTVPEEQSELACLIVDGMDMMKFSCPRNFVGCWRL